MTAKRHPDLVEELRAVLPDTPQANAVFERVRDELSPDHLLTTREAADLLGIRSINTLKSLLRAERVPTVQVGTHTRIARRQVDMLRESRRAATLREVDRRWDDVDVAFGEEGLTQEEMDALSETRPNKLPWKSS